jgi:hypothetical protein
MDTIDQFFDFIKRGEHALVNLNPHFVLVTTYPRMMPLFVHAVYGGDNFYTHALLPYSQIPLPAYLWCENTLCNRTEVFWLPNGVYALRGQSARQKILVRHRNDAHRHGLLADALR